MVTVRPFIQSIREWFGQHQKGQKIAVLLTAYKAMWLFSRLDELKSVLWYGMTINVKCKVQDDPSVTLHKGASSKYPLPFVRGLPQGGVIYFGVTV